MRRGWLVTLVFVFSSQAIACGAAKQEVSRAIDSIDSAISALDRQSTAWQQTLKTLQKELIAEGQSTLSNEVDQLASRGIARGGTELRCNADFVGHRMAQHLREIVARLRGTPPPTVLPAFCQVVPEFVDLRIEANRRSVISFYGYDLDLNEPAVQVGLMDVSGRVEDVTRFASSTTHYLLQINISSNGVPFTTTSQKLIVRAGQNALGSIPLTQATADVPIYYQREVSGASRRPSVHVRLPSDYRLIGGGCRSEWTGQGQLLTRSYPNGSEWVCEAKDHGVEDTANLIGYAIGIPANFPLSTIVTTALSGTDSHPSAVAHLPGGYSIISGGCNVNWSEPGNMLVDSYPVSAGWVCSSKDHRAASPASITAYAIGIKSSQLETVQTSAVSQPANHPSLAVSLQDATFQLVGGGCHILYGGVGIMMTATYPADDRRSWVCNGKDHLEGDPGTVETFVIGLRRRR